MEGKEVGKGQHCSPQIMGEKASLPCSNALLCALASFSDRGGLRTVSNNSRRKRKSAATRNSPRNR